MGHRRIHEIDLLRGLACLAVVAFHYLYQGQRLGLLSSHAPSWVASAARLGQLGVHLFFMISGYVIFMSVQGASLRNFAASRASRLYPALWVAAPLTAVFAWMQLNPELQVTPFELAMNLSLVPQWFKIRFVDGAYWSLAVELQFYLLVALVLALRQLRRAEALVALWLVVSAINVLRPMYPLQFWLVVNWAPYFAAGICAYQMRTDGPTPARWALYLVSFVLALAYEVLPHLRPTRGGAPDPAFAAAFAVGHALLFVLFAWISLRRSSSKGSAIVIWAGLLTYPVYLLHQHIGYVLIEKMAPSGLALGWRAALTLALVVAAATAIVVWIERPLQRSLKRWLGTPPAAARHGPQDLGATARPASQS
jgi:peptidoglycan/LPS O-acetylase OafA/YrhL